MLEVLETYIIIAFVIALVVLAILFGTGVCS